MSVLPYRLCAIDLDDTLLGPDHQISERNFRAVQAIRELGVTVVVASGRMHEAALPYVKQLALDTPIISYNGAMVKHPLTEEVWLQEKIPAKIAATLIAYCAENSLQLNFYLKDRLYSAAYTPWLKLYHERTQAPMEVLPDFATRLQGKEPIKLIIVDSPEVTEGLLPYFQNLFGDQLYVTKSNIEYLEFMPPMANKGKALEQVAQHFGVTAAQTIAFGDSWNDLPMIEWAGLGVAVGNAKPALIAAADRVAPRSDEDGVAVVLEEIFHLER